MPTSIILRTLLVLMALVLYHTAGQELEFWTSLPLSSPDENQARVALQFIAGAQLGFTVSNSDAASQTGVLQTHNVSLQVIDDGGDDQKLADNINYILQNQTEDTLGLLFASSTANARYIASQLNNTFPFINPVSSHSSLRQSNLRNVINLRPSNQAEVYGMLYSLRNNYPIQRLSFFYDTNDTDSYEAFQHIQSYISLLGLSLSSYAESTSNDVDQIQAAVKRIAIGKPTAIVVWSHSFDITTRFLIEAKKSFPADMIYAVNYAGFVESLNYTRVGNVTLLSLPVKTLFSTSFLPFKVEQAPIVTQWRRHISRYLSNSTTERSLATSAYGFEGYFTARIITQTLGQISQYPVSQEALLEQFYKTPVFKVGGWLVGPISDDTGDSIFDVCNELAHSVVLVNATSGLEALPSTTVVNNSQVSWQKCVPQGNALKPINFGTVYDPNDANILGVITGLELAFTVANQDASRRGAPQLQLLKLPISQDANYSQATLSLIADHNITALACYSEEAALAVKDVIKDEIALVDVVSNSRQFRDGTNSYFINIRVGIREQVLSSLYYLLSTPAVDDSINIGLYYQNDILGREFVAELDMALEAFKTWTDNDLPIPVPFYFNKTFTQNIKFNFIFNASSDTISSAGGPESYFTKLLPRDDHPPIDYLLASTREPDDYIIELIDALNAQQPNLTGVIAQSMIDATPHLFDHLVVIMCSSLKVLNITKLAYAAGLNNVISVSSDYSGVSRNTAFFKNPVTLIAEYANNTGATTYTERFNECGIGGYMTGKFISSVMNQLTGAVTRETFYRSIYTTSGFNLNGIQLGPYVLPTADKPGCNAGAKIEVLARPVLGKFGLQIQSARFFWGNCSAVAARYSPPADINSESSGTSITSTIIVILTIVGVVLLFCICLAIVAIVVFVIVVNPLRQKKRHLRPPRYELYATKSIFYDRANIDAMFIASSPTTGSSVKRQMLADLQSMLFQPKIAYLVLQALTKAGMAREEVSAAIMYIYYHAGKASDILKYGIQKEIVQATEESTLFREDSPLAALWQSYIRLVGIPYLWTICAETLYAIAQVSGHFKTGSSGLEPSTMLRAKSYEVDRTRLTKQNAEDEYYINILHLKLAAQQLFNKVRTTTFPNDLKWFLQSVRNETRNNFGELTNGVVANFVFLRFICLAITTPNAFGIWKKQPTNESLRFLVLLGKVLQNLAFGVEFEKEGYMKEMNDFIVQNRNVMNGWIERISGEDEEEDENFKNPKIVAKDEVKDNCVKWMYCQMWIHRQVLKRELRKRMSPEEWEEMLEGLEKIKIVNTDESSDSTNRTESGTRKGSSSVGKETEEGGEDEDKEDGDEEDDEEGEGEEESSEDLEV